MPSATDHLAPPSDTDTSPSPSDPGVQLDPAATGTPPPPTSSKPPNGTPHEAGVNSTPMSAEEKINGHKKEEDANTPVKAIPAKDEKHVKDNDDVPKTTTVAAPAAAPAPATVPTTSQAQTRRKENQSGSSTNGAVSSSRATLTNEKAPKPVIINGRAAASNKPSLLSRLFHKLVPCIGPSSSHPVDLHDDGIPVSPKVNPAATATATTSPGGAVPVTSEKAFPSKDAASASADSETAAATSTTNQQQPTIPPLVVDSHPPLNTGDGDIVVPTPTAELLPVNETGGLTSGSVQPPGSGILTTPSEHQHREKRHSRDSTAALGGDESEGTDFTDDDEIDEAGTPADEAEDEEEMLILNGGVGIPIGSDGVPKPLLPPIAPHHVGRKCLVLDLDETLVHSSFKSISQADYVVPVEIEFHWHNVYVIKRPGVDNFLKEMGKIYEIVVFTASLSKYADPVLDKLDIHQVVTHRLFRESCYNHKGNYVKDLSQLGRPIADTIILDNSPASYIFHPNNAVPVSSWFNDPHDTELTDLVPFLADLSEVEDVRGVLDGAR